VRSIFAKTVAWSLGTLALAVVGLVVTAVYIAPPPGDLQLFERLGEQLALDSQGDYEQEGAVALARRLERLRRSGGVEFYFTDAAGRDLVGGEDRSELKARATDRLGKHLTGPPAAAHPSADGSFWLLVRLRPEYAPARLLPYFLWVLVLVVLLSLALAWHFAYPLRQLRRVIESFGRGEADARARPQRRDEFGDLARAFDGMADRIETLLGAERRLLRDVSHELRSPLTRLGFAIELARSSPDPEAALARVRREADRLGALVDELLQLTRAEGDPAARSDDVVDLADVVREVADDAELEATGRGCAVRVEAADPAAVVGDRELLRRAVENVVRNAIRYSPAGGVVEVTLRVGGGRAAVEVRDRGPGVPAEALAELFKPFFRVDGHRGRDTGGTGLGLAIAERAVRLHGGDIRAENAGPGLRVVLDVPLSGLPLVGGPGGV